MKKLLLTVAFALGTIIASSCMVNAHENGVPHFHPHPYYYYPPVYYYPVVGWYPYGTNATFGPVAVSPDRRYVRFGINATFSQYNGFSTFNYATGETRYYPPVKNSPLR